MTRFSAALILTFPALTARAEEPAPPPVTFAVRVQAVLNSPFTKQILAAHGEDFKKAMAEGEAELGFPPTKVVAVSGHLQFGRGQFTDQYPTVVLELPDAAETAAMVTKLKLTESLTRENVPGFPNARCYRVRDKGEYRVVDGSRVVIIETSKDQSPRSVTDVVRESASALTRHPESIRACESAKAHLRVEFGNAFLYHLAGLPVSDFAEPYLPLVKAKGYVLAHSFEEKVIIDLRGTFSSPEDADAAKDAATQALALYGVGLNLIKSQLASDPTTTKDEMIWFDYAVAMRKGLKPTTAGTDLVIRSETAIPAGGAESLIRAVSKLRTAAANKKSQNNLKQIAIGVFEYSAKHNELPGNYFAKDGSPLLSWRVRLLPYMDEGDLFKRIKLDEPWDSEHNKKVAVKMPAAYTHPNSTSSETGLTHYRAFAPKGKGNPRTFLPSYPTERRSLKDITDGLSTTIAVIEAAEAVAWMKPDDLVFQADDELPAFGNFFPAGTNVLMGDGSIRILNRSTVSEKTIKALITSNGGEILQLQK